MKALHLAAGISFLAADPLCKRGGKRPAVSRLRNRVTCGHCRRLMRTNLAVGIAGFVPDDYEAGVAEGYSEAQLWLGTWGTQTGLVWAASAQWAEARIRRRAFDPRLSPEKVIRRVQVIDGEVKVRLATPADLQRWDLAGGPKIVNR